MHLKSLTLKGFKSFAAPTTFVFEQGVTAVVGPNGSGKSNIVDALAWVMGEQGAKTLRGGAMSDVIFAGTSNKAPLGRAEVLLTIDNTDGALPIDYTEVTIGRVLFRNGTSEYSINGESCRLLDVQELLSDSGLGREMHVIVGQGQLDTVLHATAEQRRGFIEEAAGILKHRRRKEKTVRKLEAMDTNLTRLGDLANEIRRQLKPLGAQAEIAREAAVIQATVRDARARLLADEVVALRTALTAHSLNESQRASERAALTEKLEQVKIRQHRLAQNDISKQAESMRTTLFALEQSQERFRSLFNLAKQSVSLISSEDSFSPSSNTVTESDIDNSREAIEKASTFVIEAESAVDAHLTLVAEARVALQRIDEDLNAQNELVSAHDLRIAAYGSAVAVAEAELKSVLEQIETVKENLKIANESRERIQSEIAEAENESEHPDNEATLLDGRWNAARAKLDAARQVIESSREELHNAERERSSLLAKQSALELTIEKKDGTAELSAKLPKLARRISEVVKVDKGYETAIGFALGALADALIAKDFEEAIEAAKFASGNQIGRISVVVAEATSSGTELFEPAGTTNATKVIDAPSGVLNLLRDFAVAEDLDAARAAFKNSENTSGTIITKGGEVVTRSMLSAGVASPTSIELIAARDAATNDLQKLQKTIESLRLSLAKAQEEAQMASVDADNALTDLREFDAQAAAHTERIARLKAQLENSAVDIQKLGSQHAALEEAILSAGKNLERAKETLTLYEATPRPVVDLAAREQASLGLENLRNREMDLRVELETARERQRQANRDLQQLITQQQREIREAEEAKRLQAKRSQQLRVASQVMEQLPSVLEVIAASVQEARGELEALSQKRLMQDTEVAELRTAELALREELQTITESVHGLELQIYEKKLQLSSLLERSAEDLGLVEDVLVAEYGPDQMIPDAEGEESKTFVREEQQLRLDRAERKLTQLGRVNPLALEEFAALEQRHTYLNEQLEDLRAAKRDLLSIVTDLDETMQEVFVEAFEDTKKAFQDIFPMLFPGGTGSISLSNPEDLLTTGIEVSVKPAGKRIERLSLLSGGERSLAAVALLVAIFMARPSPFYILDEVEAALDDSNLGRLLSVFEMLRKNSQLIIVTHQKRTMEIADSLYGVSMRQNGVSQVVGQRLAKESA